MIELPLISIAEPSDPRPIEAAIDEIPSFDWIVFTSANGVRSFFDKLGERKEKIRASFACVGSETEKTLREKGFQSSIVPKRFLTGELGREMTLEFALSRKKVLLARAEEANREIAQTLREAGAIVVEAPVYRTVRRDFPDSSDLLQKISDITLTSPSTVDALAASFNVREIGSRRIRIHCIGPVTAERARNAGLNVDTTAKVHTIDGLVDSVVRASGLSEERRRSSVASF